MSSWGTRLLRTEELLLFGKHLVFDTAFRGNVTWRLHCSHLPGLSPVQAGG